MLKRGYLIQPAELTEHHAPAWHSQTRHLGWQEVGARGQSLIFYFAADTTQAKRNAEN
jgi:hypothetical protein